MSRDLIVTARRLARANPSRPKQADLKRAISTAYYAMFHAVARDCADLFAGAGPSRPQRAWSQVYRALDHGPAKAACTQVRNLGFPQPIVDFADTFISLQEERHQADYDPDARYARAEVILLIAKAERALSTLRGATRRDRRAFAVLLMFRRR